MGDMCPLHVEAGGNQQQPRTWTTPKQPQTTDQQPSATQLQQQQQQRKQQPQQPQQHRQQHEHVGRPRGEKMLMRWGPHLRAQPIAPRMPTGHDNSNHNNHKQPQQ